MTDLKRLSGRTIQKESNGIILDVGANTGQTATTLLREFPKSPIHCFEPAEQSFQQLIENLRGSQQVECHQLALGEEETESILYHHECSLLNSMIEGINPDKLQQESVNVSCIDSVSMELGDPAILLLKTDTEGFDLAVVQGAQRCIKEGRVEFILAEVAFHQSDIRHTCFHALNRHLQNLGFRFSGLYDQVLDFKGRHFECANALFQYDG